MARGAPRRYTALDQPDGPFDPLVPDDEVARIEAQRAEVDAALEDVVRDPADAPWNVTLAVPNQGSSPPQSADVPQLDSVLMPICDPGFARYLGFSDNIGKAIRRDMVNPLIGLVVSGVFAVDPQRVISEIQFGPFKLITRLEDRLPPLDADEQEMVDRVLDLTGARDIADKLRGDGYEIRCFTAAAGAVPPPDPLPAPGVSLAEANWIAAASGISTSFRQGFDLSTTPFAPLLAMARDDGKGFEPRTRVHQDPDRAKTRRAAARRGQCGTRDRVRCADLLGRKEPLSFLLRRPVRPLRRSRRHRRARSRPPRSATAGAACHAAARGAQRPSTWRPVAGLARRAGARSRQQFGRYRRPSNRKACAHLRRRNPQSCCRTRNDDCTGVCVAATRAAAERLLASHRLLR